MQPTSSNAKPVLVISQDVVGTLMAGPGIRYYQLARVLAREFPVQLAIPAGSTLETAPGFELLKYSRGDEPALLRAIHGARAVVLSAVAVAWFPELAQAGVPIAVDGYNPFQSETFYLRESQASDQVAELTPAYLEGDFFFCASERQRDWWLGLLEANGRVNIHNYHEDPTFRRLIDLVPYGLSEVAPVHTRHLLKGVWPGIGVDDKVLLWGGGLWPWLDPLTAIRAVSRLGESRPDVRLLFPATRHPNAAMAAFPSLTEAARRLAAELGLLDRTVFFGDWVPYADWVNVLLESDVALTLHPRDTLESRLAFRTRVLDYIWAGLPTVAARGDVLADLIGDQQLGAVVEPEAPDQVAAAVLRLLAVPRADWQTRFEAARRALNWEAVIGPLAVFCRHPRVAPDKVANGANLGNAYYVRQRLALEKMQADLRARVQDYEASHALRWLRRLDPLILRVARLRRWVRP